MAAEIDPNPVSGKEIEDRRRFVVIALREINAFGVSMTVPTTTGEPLLATSD